MNGTVTHIFTTPVAARSLESRTEVRAVPGLGLDGDRYYNQCGTFSEDDSNHDRELTLIQIEHIEGLKDSLGIELVPSEARRNIVTRGIALNDLVGSEFSVGAVKLRGIRLCEPCVHMEELAGKRVLQGLIHKGGLRAQIIEGGLIKVGDSVQVTAAAE